MEHEILKLIKEYESRVQELDKSIELLKKEKSEIRTAIRENTYSDSLENATMKQDSIRIEMKVKGAVRQRQFQVIVDLKEILGEF